MGIQMGTNWPLHSAAPKGTRSSAQPVVHEAGKEPLQSFGSTDSQHVARTAGRSASFVKPQPATFATSCSARAAARAVAAGRIATAALLWPWRPGFSFVSGAAYSSNGGHLLSLSSHPLCWLHVLNLVCQETKFSSKFSFSRRAYST